MGKVGRVALERATNDHSKQLSASSNDRDTNLPLRPDTTSASESFDKLVDVHVKKRWTIP